MIVDVKVPPDLWNEDGQGVIANWLVRDGERVQEGTVLAELMYEKSSMELLAPVAGIVAVLVPVETPVDKGQRLALIDTAG